MPKYKPRPLKYPPVCVCGAKKDRRSELCIPCWEKSILRPQDPTVFDVDGKPCCRISLTQEQFAIISACKFEEIARDNWVAWWNVKTLSFYAVRKQKRGGVEFSIFMHNQIKPSEDGLITDHINKNSLDNRDDNLRPNTTKSQNMMNSGKRRNNKSGYKWVSYVERLKKYHAQIRINGKQTSLGWFDTALEAHLAACEVAKKIHGEFYRPD